ncbi:hypothetical protein PL373_11010 [Tenacibaculum maritimum]|nr:hypothetical protein [Tenacibaculum maritimum]MDB0601607.1 hypothetical protein [Tenacibaculum maritimum]MDB0601622.1 hypothetical protein [Tenacibaculum maritimum]MDB0601669.1 hypothetical protein [Tenacibaculum maritimum]MDB0612856.1 hypothetical protein [Tenacibaculum maritimum]
MQNNKKIEEVGKMLPHGSKKLIAKKADVSYNTVVQYFKGREVSFGIQTKLIPVINEYIELFEETKKAKEKMLKYAE